MKAILTILSLFCMGCAPIGAVLKGAGDGLSHQSKQPKKVYHCVPDMATGESYCD